MNLAIVVAGGKGTRLGREGGKQLMPLGDKPALAHTLTAFQQASTIDAIIVVAAKENFDRCMSIIDKYGILKADHIAVAGAERQDSVYSGLKAVAEFESVGVVAIHDGARPLITPAIIDEAVRALNGCDGVVVGIPAKDTIKLVRDGLVSKTLERADTWQIQTPQVFSYEMLLKAHESARLQGLHGTDDSVLVEQIGGVIKVVLGSDENIKITTPTDVLIAEAILKARSRQESK